MKKISLSLPLLPEQKAIASILSSLDDKIELNRRMNETLEAMARAIFKDWFVDFGPTRAKMEGRAAYLPEHIWILEWQHQTAQQETDDTGKKQAHRRYQDAVLALSKAFALAAASDEACRIRDEVGLFRVKPAPTAPRENREFAVQQIIDRAVVSTEIVDILSAAGLSSPNISILSDDFLLEIQQMKQKNLALEALKRLLNDEIHSRTRINVTEEKKFSERLEQAIARYHTNPISTIEVIQELIHLAQDIKTARKRGEEQGLTADEIAFYDALAENESAVEVMGNDKLKVIAHELLMSLKSNVTVDWDHRETARARLRSNVKRILRKYGYPPDLQAVAVQNVLQQAEALSASWAVG